MREITSYAKSRANVISAGNKFPFYSTQINLTKVDALWDIISFKIKTIE